jgi:hypothetical protein
VAADWAPKSVLSIPVQAFFGKKSKIKILNFF